MTSIQEVVKTLERLGSTTKKCSDCKKVKDKSEFYQDKKSSDGKTYNCKECSRNMARKFLAKRREAK